MFNTTFDTPTKNPTQLKQFNRPHKTSSIQIQIDIA